MKQLIFVLLTTLSIFAKGNNYINYFKSIKNAEVYITKNQLDSAFSIYSEIFSLYRPLDKDLYNACKVAVKIGKLDTEAKFLISLSQMNTDKKHLNRRCFKPLRKSNVWIKYISQNNNNLKDFFPNQKIQIQIDSLFEIDQKFRQKTGSYSLYGDTIKKIDSLNSIALKKLIDEGNFPRYQPLNRKNNELFKHAYILLRHSYQNKLYLSDRLLKCLKKGMITPFIYAELEDKKHSTLKKDKYSYGSLNFIMFEWFPLRKQIVPIKKDSAIMNAIEENRSTIGMHSQSVINTITNSKSSLYYNGFFFGYYESLIYIRTNPNKF